MAACVACAALTWHQLNFWRSSRTLFHHTLDVTSANARAHDYYAQALLEDDEIEEALVHFARAVALEPGNPQPRYNLAVAYRRAGDVRRARASALSAVAVDADYSPALFLLGTLA
ncbi:MAG: tetratricopeptide repeat protein, partial [Gammaproteobacteria bacterium]|nr:tetratricopeptide repeat protein [Gammaproteobacteria bacterium]